MRRDLSKYLLAALCTAACANAPAGGGPTSFFTSDGDASTLPDGATPTGDAAGTATPTDAISDSVPADTAKGDAPVIAPDTSAPTDTMPDSDTVAPDTNPGGCKSVAECDDGEPCTVDGCNTSTGKCSHAPVPSCGEPGAPCDALNPCGAGVCDKAANACVDCLVSAECGGGKLCQAKKCVAATACKSDVDCKAQKQVCSKFDGACVDCNVPGDCGPGNTCIDHQCKPAATCASSKDCQKVCDLKNGFCVDCLSSDDCGKGQFCMPATHQCVPAVCDGNACGAGGSFFLCNKDGSGYEAGVSCDDGNPCTTHKCDAKGGCKQVDSDGKCDDKDACTEDDKCTAGMCAGAPADCDDMNPCTVDSCLKTTGCQNKAGLGPCNDDDECTLNDLCSGGKCQGTKKQCQDNNPCTDDACDKALGCTFDANNAPCDDKNVCTSQDMCKASACQGVAKNCDDGNPCTSDGCDPLVGCKYGNSSGPCDDKNPCTTGDTCSGGKCAPGTAKCDDKNVCTTDSCKAPAGTCGNELIPGCCLKDAECDDKDPCTLDVCAGNKCANKTICCKDPVADCDDGDACTKDTCMAGKCGHEAPLPPPATPVYAADWEGGLDGFTVDPAGSDTAGNKVQWTWKQTKFKAGAGALHFGNPAGGAYTLKSIVTGYALGPKFTVPANQGALLELWATFDTSSTTSTNRVEVLVAQAGKGDFPLGNKYPDAGKTWQQFTYDLSPFAGAEIQIKLRGQLYGYSTTPQTGGGLWVDALTVKAQCQTKACKLDGDCANTTPCGVGRCAVTGFCAYKQECCTSAANCDDGNPSTTDTCSIGKCVHTKIAGACQSDLDCNDGKKCTWDVCSGNKCQVPVKLTDCCETNADCDDQSTCTNDTCGGDGKCQHVDNKTCCKDDAQCQDGETKCTLDSCNKTTGACVHTPTGAPGCCVPTVWLENFDGAALQGWTGASSTKGWQQWKTATQVKSPPGVLYYGDPVAKNFNWGTSSGTALSPKIDVPNTTSAVNLHMWLYYDTEGGGEGSFDDIYVHVLSAGLPTAKAWSKSSPGAITGQWIQINYNLAAFKGKPIQVQFLFDTKDNIANTGLGVIFDDVGVIQTCP
jgi:hypothetical protein